MLIGADSPLTRRAALALATAAAAQCGQLRPAAAADSAPAVSSRARLLVSIGTGEPQEMVLGLYDEASPASVALFKGLCAGKLPEADAGCGSAGCPALSYSGSTASRIEKDRIIVLGKISQGAQYIDRSIDGTGYVRSELINRADSFKTDDPAGLSHDRPGLVSMKRGGGAFEFALSPKPNRALDSEWTVIGEVLSGPLEELNKVSRSRARIPA